MDIYSFDLKMTVVRSMVRDKVWIFRFFYHKVCFVLCPETRLGFFFLLKRQCASFPFCGLENRVGVLNILIKKISQFHSMA